MVHKPPVNRRLADALRPFYATVTAAWTSPAAAGTLDLSNGSVLNETVWDAMVSNFLWLGGTTAAFANWTPTLTQTGALTITAPAGRYWQIGKLVIATFDLTINSAGTGGAVMTLGAIPVASRIVASTIGGFAWYFDNSVVTNYHLAPVWASSTTCTFVANASTGGFGANPAVTAAASDFLRGTLVYEAG